MATNTSIPADPAITVPPDAQFPTAARASIPSLMPGQAVRLDLTQEARLCVPGQTAWFISYNGIVFGYKSPTMPGWNFTLAFSLRSVSGTYYKQFYVAIDHLVTQYEDGGWHFSGEDETFKFPVFSQFETRHVLEIILFDSCWVFIRLVA